MYIETVTQDVAVIACSALLLYAALHDVVGRMIPNSVSIILVVLGVLRATLAHTLLPTILIAVAVLGLAMLVWQAGLLGGGDVKLLASTCLVVPPQGVPMLLASISIAGGLLACIYVAARHVVPVPSAQRPADVFRRAVRVELWRIHRRGPLPYAVAIALGAMTQIAAH